MQELAEELVLRGHEVTVATCYPQYNLAQTGFEKDYEELSVEKGVRVIRIRTLPHKKVGYLFRGVSQVMLPYIFLKTLKKYLNDKIDCVLVYSPPLPLWKLGHFIKRKFGASFILNLQDIFPQNAIDLGILNNRLLIKYFEYMESRAYESADVITVHSEGNRQFLLENKDIDAGRLEVLHNWIEIEQGKKNEGQLFRKKLNLEGKFIFFFGGVMGPSQGLDLVLGAAELLKREKDIAILLVGDGVEKENLENLANRLNLENVVFHPFISKEDYRKMVDEIDVGLVCLSNRNNTPVVPGKILSYMAAKKPVCAFLNSESDGHMIIRKAKCGESAVSGDVNKAYELMLKIYNERNSLDTLGCNGYSYAVEHFSQKVCVDRLERLMKR